MCTRSEQNVWIRLGKSEKPSVSYYLSLLGNSDTFYSQTRQKKLIKYHSKIENQKWTFVSNCMDFYCLSGTDMTVQTVAFHASAIQRTPFKTGFNIFSTLWSVSYELVNQRAEYLMCFLWSLWVILIYIFFFFKYSWTFKTLFSDIRKHFLLVFTIYYTMYNMLLRAGVMYCISRASWFHRMHGYVEGSYVHMYMCECGMWYNFDLRLIY